MPDTKERPILFSGEMVRAILEGRKTQTRRVVKILRTDIHPQVGATIVTLPGGKQAWLNSQIDHPYHITKFCPYGVPGDRLWVRETFCACTDECGLDEGFAPGVRTCFRADGKAQCDPDEMTWTPAIHMPRRASRITLEITGVRVERVRDISEDDARVEGADPVDAAHDNDLPRLSFRDGFRALWDSINARLGFGWDTNPWVWVIEFRRMENA